MLRSNLPQNEKPRLKYKTQKLLKQESIPANIC